MSTLIKQVTNGQVVFILPPCYLPGPCPNNSFVTSNAMGLYWGGRGHSYQCPSQAMGLEGHTISAHDRTHAVREGRTPRPTSEGQGWIM